MKALLSTALAAMVALAAHAGANPTKTKHLMDRYDVSDPAMMVMENALLELLRDGGASKSAFLAKAQANAAHAMRGDKVQLVLLVEDPQEAASRLKAEGYEIVHVFDKFGCRTVTVRVAEPDRMKALASLDPVERIYLEPEVILDAGSVPGQGVAGMTADLAAQNYGVDGSGVTIGIISDSIFATRLGGGNAPAQHPGAYTATTDQLSGDLPTSVWVVDPYRPEQDDPPGTDEGNAMAQIIHDNAPGATLTFASAFNGYQQFADNILALANDATFPADVIVDDVKILPEPLFQDGPIAQAYDTAFASGVACFSSMGNNGDSTHQAPYNDVNEAIDDTPTAPSGNDLHDFGGGDVFFSVALGAGESLSAVLRWSEPYDGSFAAGPGAASDLDLYLVNSTAIPFTQTSFITASADVQGTPANPSGIPLERVTYTNQTGAAQTLHLAIEHFDGRDPEYVNLQVSLIGPNASYDDPQFLGGQTSFGHALADGVMATAAAFFCEIDTGGNVFDPQGRIDAESFSSFGGNVPILFDENGDSIPEVQRPKPDIAAPNGVNTTFFGQFEFFGENDVACGEDDAFPNFFGTSAAAPHAAAAAALMLQYANDNNIDLPPSEMYGLMETLSTDISEPGYDFFGGNGPLDVNRLISEGLADDQEPTPTPDPGEPCQQPDEDEPNDSIQTATPFVVEDTIERTIHSIADVDYYSFQAGAGAELIAFTEFLSGPNADTTLTLLDGDGNQLAFEDDQGVLRESLLAFTMPAAGTYYIVVDDKSSQGTGIGTCYGLAISVQGGTGDVCQVADTNEPNGSIGQATPFPVGQSISATIDNANDEDYFSFSFGAGATITAETSNLSGPLGDTLITLYDDAGNEIASNDDGEGIGLASRIVVTINNAGGTFFLEVDEFEGNESGTCYDLTIMVEGGNPTPTPTATPGPNNPPGAAQLGIVLAARIDQQAVDPDGDTVRYTYRWTSSGGDTPVEQGPTTALEDFLREGDGGATFDVGETWTVTVTPSDGRGGVGPPVTGQFFIGSEGVSFEGWTIQ